MSERRMQEELERRLRSLGGSVPPEVNFVNDVMARLRVEAVSPARWKRVRLWRLVMKGMLGVAASAVVAAAVWHFSLGTPRTAYGMDDLPQRLLTLKSLHIKGTIYGQDGTGQPLELWAERPNKLRINGRLGEGSGESTSTDEIITADSCTMIDGTKKQVVISGERPVDAELSTEQFMQQVTQMLLGPGQQGFTKVRDEQIGNVKAAVYESQLKEPGATLRTEVALDPQSGLPLRALMFMKVGEEAERKCMDMATVEANAAIAPETFVYKAPADYQVSRVDAAEIMASQAGNLRCSVRYMIALNAHDTLMCWSRYDVNNPGGDLAFPGPGEGATITDESGGVCEEHLLHADKTAAGYHWRWSVVHSATAKDLGRTLITSIQSTGGTTSGSQMPVQLPPEELERVVKEAQRVTLPEGQTPLSVKEIERAAGAK